MKLDDLIGTSCAIIGVLQHVISNHTGSGEFGIEALRRLCVVSFGILSVS